MVHLKTFPSEQNMETPIAKAAAFACQRAQTAAQPGVIRRFASIAETGPIHADQLAGMPLAQLITCDCVRHS